MLDYQPRGDKIIKGGSPFWPVWKKSCECSIKYIFSDVFLHEKFINSFKKKVKCRKKKLWAKKLLKKWFFGVRVRHRFECSKDLLSLDVEFDHLSGNIIKNSVRCRKNVIIAKSLEWLVLTFGDGEFFRGTGAHIRRWWIFSRNWCYYLNMRTFQDPCWKYMGHFLPTSCESKKIHLVHLTQRQPRRIRMMSNVPNREFLTLRVTPMLSSIDPLSVKLMVIASLLTLSLWRLTRNQVLSSLLFPFRQASSSLLWAVDLPSIMHLSQLPQAMFSLRIFHILC